MPFPINLMCVYSKIYCKLRIVVNSKIYYSVLMSIIFDYGVWFLSAVRVWTISPYVKLKSATPIKKNYFPSAVDARVPRQFAVRLAWVSPRWMFSIFSLKRRRSLNTLPSESEGINLLSWLVRFTGCLWIRLWKPRSIYTIKYVLFKGVLKKTTLVDLAPLPFINVSNQAT